MKIGFIIPSMLGGGAERVMSILCNEFCRRGNDIILMLSEDSDNVSYQLSDDVKICDISSDNSGFVAKVPDYINKIKNNIIEHKIDLIVSFITRTNICAIIAAKITHTPVIVSERNNPYLVPGSSFLRKIRDFIYRYSDGVVFQTGYARDYFCKRIRDKSTIIMNPISESVKKYENSHKINVIVTACRLAPQKNLTLLIKAFSKIANQIPDYNVEIYGEGEEKDKLSLLISELGLENRIILKGYSKNVIEKVARAKIFVLSSDFEGLSNSVIEAMCVGTACVVTDSPTYGNRDLIINGENGFLVDVGDDDALAKRILKLAVDEDLNAKVSQNAKEMYFRVNCDQIIKEWEEFIMSIIGEKND